MNYTLLTRRPIKSEADLDAALTRISEIMSAQPGTPEGEELDLLSELVWAYEQKNYPITPPDPIDLLNSKIEDQEITLDQLKEVLPNRSTRSQILSKHRRIPLKSALKMIDHQWIPMESFFSTDYWHSFDK